MLREQFWERFPLTELSQDEWEALCDGCGRCCLLKLEDEDTRDIVFTRIACKLLDTDTGRCSNYGCRQQHVPDCIVLTPAIVATLRSLPTTCAYRRLSEGKALPKWHPLLTGDPDSVRRGRASVAGRVLSETEVAEEDLEEYVVTWVRV